MNNNFQFFSKYLESLKSSPNNQNVLCPFHEDTQASLSVDIEKGLFYCHSCGKGGDIFKWVMIWEHVDFRKAKQKILGDARLSVLSETEVDVAHDYLLKHKEIQDMLFKHRGWLLNTLIKFRLGWNDLEKRVQIPIYNDKKELINIRKYLVVGKVTKQNPKFRGIRGHNERYFFPIENLLKEEFILLCAGEPDTILACQLGMNAGTFTGGEGNFNRDLLPLFKDKLVYICYDKDLAGARGLKTVGKEIHKFANEVRVVDLPFNYGG